MQAVPARIADAPSRMGWAAFAIMPALAMTLFFLAGDVQALTDPCMQWGSTTTTLTPDAACPSVTASSQTLGAYVAMMLAIKGTLLAGCAIVFVGTLKARPGVVVTGAWVLFAVALPLMLGRGGIPALVSAALALVACRQTCGAFVGPAAWGARTLAVLVTLGALAQLAGAVGSGIARFLLVSALLMTVPALMLWAVWWPHSAHA